MLRMFSESHCRFKTSQLLPLSRCPSCFADVGVTFVNDSGCRCGCRCGVVGVGVGMGVGVGVGVGVVFRKGAGCLSWHSFIPELSPDPETFCRSPKIS